MPGGTTTKAPKPKKDELPDLNGLQAPTTQEPDNKLDEAIGAMEATQGGTSSFGEFDGANSAKETWNKSQGRTEGSAKDEGKWGDSNSQKGVAVTAGVMSTFDLALDVTRAVKVFMDSGSDGMDKTGAVISTVTTASKAAEGIGAIVKTGQENAGAATSLTESAGKIMGEITGILTVISAGFTLVKNIVALVQKGAEMNEMEKRAKIGESVKAVLDMGKGTIETINKFMEHLGTVSGPLLQAAPGIGIAINVLDVIMNGVNIGYSFVSWSEMRDDKRSFKDKAEKSGNYKREKTFWGGNSSYEATAKGNVKVSEDAELAEKAQTSKQQELDKAKSDVGKNRLLLNSLLAQRRSVGKDPRKKKDLEDKITVTKTDLTNAEATLAVAQGDFDKAKALAGTTAAARDKLGGDTIENSKEYLISKQLQEISAKRIRRGALNISLALPAIAGDIAVLSGAGAAVGAGLKAGSGGGKLLALGIRMGKQAYHNARGDEKSTENKGKMYDSIIKGITGHVQSADTPEKKAKALREISASGMTTMTMQALKAKGGSELYKAWVSALKQR